MLIVTYTDHTAHARPSVRNEPKSESFPYSDLQLYPLSHAQEKQLTDAKRLAGTLFAVTVIEGLLEYSESYKRHFRGKSDPISPWPLTPAQASGLHAALYHLHQYVGTLHPEPGG
jgi:hypothetical protein